MKKRIFIFFLAQAFLYGMLFSAPSVTGGMSVNGTCFVFFNDEDGFRIYSDGKSDSRKDNQEKQCSGKEIFIKKTEDGFDKDTQVFFEKGFECSFFLLLKKYSSSAFLFKVKESGETDFEKLILSCSPDGSFVSFKNTFDGNLHIIFSSEEGIIEDIISSKTFAQLSSCRLVSEKLQYVSDFSFETENVFIFKNKEKTVLLKTCGFYSWEQYEYKNDFSMFFADYDSSCVYCAESLNGMLYVCELSTGELKKVFTTPEIPFLEHAFIYKEIFYFFSEKDGEKLFSATSKNGEILFTKRFTDCEIIASGEKSYFLFNDGTLKLLFLSDVFFCMELPELCAENRILTAFNNKVFLYSDGCINVYKVSGSGLLKLKSINIDEISGKENLFLKDFNETVYDRKTGTYFITENDCFLKINSASASLIKPDVYGIISEENRFSFLYFIKNGTLTFFKAED